MTSRSLTPTEHAVLGALAAEPTGLTYPNVMYRIDERPSATRIALSALWAYNAVHLTVDSLWTLTATGKAIRETGRLG